uniref:Tubulin beta chain n=1 Tax=Teleopsis dalmanni TaxID=139649 RepID=I6T373_TELDL|nr:beta-tubulin [Teleopsis dalmanni]
MREIVHLQVGQCGNQIGSKFWQEISQEHGIDPNGVYCGNKDLQLERVNVYYTQGPSANYVPRAVFVDLQPSTLNSVRSSEYGKLYRPDNFISGQGSAGNNWAKGHYSDGMMLLESVFEVIRKEMEDCDCPQGCQLVHSLGGGTGSGFGTLLISKLRDEYPRLLLLNFSVFSGNKASDIVVQPYNCALGISHMIGNTDQTICIDNDALYNMCQQSKHTDSLMYLDLNELISSTMADVTTCLRFPGKMSIDLRKLAVNMVPFPRLHFLIPGHIAITPATTTENIHTVSNIIREMFEAKNMLTTCDLRYGHYLSIAAIFRGRVSLKEIDDEMLNVQKMKMFQFADWIPNYCKTDVCDIPRRGEEFSATFLANSTSVHETFNQIKAHFSAMFKRKAFLHWYMGEGMEQLDFIEARSNLNDLISEYQKCQELAAVYGSNRAME